MWVRQAVFEGVCNAAKYGIEWGVKFGIATICVTAGAWVLIQACK